MYPLLHRSLWLAGGAVLVAVVIVLSLLPAEEGVLPPSLQDKTGHFIAYGTLMLWFAGIWRRRSHGWIALAFVVLGIALEFLQSFIPLRFSDHLDMVANTAGVALGLMLAWLGLDRWAHWCERWLFGVAEPPDGG